MEAQNAMGSVREEKKLSFRSVINSYTCVPDCQHELSLIALLYSQGLQNWKSRGHLKQIQDADALGETGPYSCSCSTLELDVGTNPLRGVSIRKWLAIVSLSR
ncbi:hypothetical protein Ancab_033539 [Ancistrocladus abbreviatus]